MNKTFTPTETQKAAAKPWMIGIFASMGLGIASMLCLCLYFYISSEINFWIVGLWISATSVITDASAVFCNQKMARIAGMDPPRLTRCWFRWTLLTAFWLFIALSMSW